MKSVRTVAQLRAELAPARRAGLEVGLVPTMGSLHAGHLSLIERAREQCDFVVVSLFVNPAQFDEDADLERYPRQEQADARLAAAAGADLLFSPAAAEVYPEGFSTTVEVRGVGERLEGEARGAEHFRGVSTVVTKLLCMTQPAVAYFGQKDAQQVTVIRRLVEDLNLPVRIEALPIVREADGLAMSSRNALLSAHERERARALPDALRHAQSLVEEGERSSAAILAAVHAQLRHAGLRADYVALVDPVSFEELPALSEQALLLIAARVGSVRLIDNALLGARIGLGAAPAACRDAEHAQEVAACSA
jgi:pantoate--beta-alanine ligase